LAYLYLMYFGDKIQITLPFFALIIKYWIYWPFFGWS
jgi:hypothetical protein